MGTIFLTLFGQFFVFMVPALFKLDKIASFSSCFLVFPNVRGLSASFLFLFFSH